tara:strand:- start:23 stop:1654 length:1632 start_codon:yes stop_codon:yes gene_type:complete
MAGGLMNLTAYGNENIILHGNPKKTFFKSTYKKHTNFGLQRFRINYEGSRVLNFNTPTYLEFKIPRYAELLYDTYLCVTIPNIFSSFLYDQQGIGGNNLRPYEFRWIEELGSTMIREIEIFSGGTTIARYSGEYLTCVKERDYSKSKKELWDNMTGNVIQLNDPANAGGNINVYPNSMYVDETGVEPSIRGRKLYIPINSFFCDSSKLALPLVAIQYQEISIKITIEPVKNLYTINNVDDMSGNSTGISYRTAPNPNIVGHQLWHFLQPPSDFKASFENYDTTRNDWNSDVHLIGTYIFLGQDERRVFAEQNHHILIKQPFEYEHLSCAGSKVLDIETNGLVSNYMFRFRRSDVFERNEWTNYTNWAYNNILPIKSTSVFPIESGIANPNQYNITGSIGTYAYNQKNILLDMGILLQGVYRENVLDSGIYEYVEKFKRTSGGAKNGLYCYNFCLNSDRTFYQPSGAINMNKFAHVSFEFNTIEPPINPIGSTVEVICDEQQNPIGFRKNVEELKSFNYDLKIFEEKYNLLIITGGKIGLMNAT